MPTLATALMTDVVSEDVATVSTTIATIIRKTQISQRLILLKSTAM